MTNRDVEPDVFGDVRGADTLGETFESRPHFHEWATVLPGWYPGWCCGLVQSVPGLERSPGPPPCPDQA